MEYKELQEINFGTPSLELLQKALNEYTGEIDYYTKKVEELKRAQKAAKIKLKATKSWVKSLQERIDENNY